MNAMESTDWSKQLFDALVNAGVTLFAYVPDAGNKRLIEYAQEHQKTRSILLTTEEEGVAVCAGADLVGGKAIACMQSSGVGNIPNFLSFAKGGRFPLLMMITMRGDFGEQNPWQYPMGEAVEPILTAMGVLIFKVETPEELEPVTQAALSAAFKAGKASALILTQRFLGAKPF